MPTWPHYPMTLVRLKSPLERRILTTGKELLKNREEWIDENSTLIAGKLHEGFKPITTRLLLNLKYNHNGTVQILK